MFEVDRSMEVILSAAGTQDEDAQIHLVVKESEILARVPTCELNFVYNSLYDLYYVFYF